MSSFKFPSKEKLKSKKQIELLFKSGQSIAAFPVLGIYTTHPKTDIPLQTAVTVSKKHFKKAVTRNLIKRRMKEAWRLRKNDFTERLAQSNLSVHIILIFIGKEVLSYADIDKGIKKLIKKLNKELTELQ